MPIDEVMGLMLGVPGAQGASWSDPQIVVLSTSNTDVDNTTLREDGPNSVYYTSTRIYVGDIDTSAGTIRARGLFWFDISDIPANAQIVTATLALYMNYRYATVAGTYRAYRLTRWWIDSQSTWNSYRTSQSWTAAGAFDADDCEQSDIGRCDILPTDDVGYKEFVLDPAKVQEWTRGITPNHGLLIKADAEDADGYGFASTEDLEADRHPKLTIVYRVPVSGATSSEYFALGDTVQAIDGNPTLRHNFHPAHATRISEVNLTIDGAVRKYVAYDCEPGGLEIRLYYSNDLDGLWAQYSGNPVLGPAATALYRWPSVAWDGATLHMFLSNRTDKRIERWTSADGINFALAGTVYQSDSADPQYINSFIWLNPNDNRWHLYYNHEDAGIRYLSLKTSSTLAGLSAAPSVLIAGGVEGQPLEITAAPTVLYHAPYYWLLTEGYPSPGYWATFAFRSFRPDGGFTKAPTNPILGTATDGQACAIHLFSPAGDAIWIYSSRETDAEWYIDMTKISL